MMGQMNICYGVMKKWKAMMFSDTNKIEQHSNPREYVQRSVSARNKPRYQQRFEI